MELSISQQALSLLYFSLLGLALGLVYDLLRLFRYGTRHALIWDGLFCLAAAAGCFYLSMARESSGFWNIPAALAFFCFYINCISRLVFPIFSQVFRLIGNFVRFLEKKYFFLKIFLFKQK